MRNETKSSNRFPEPNGFFQPPLGGSLLACGHSGDRLEGLALKRFTAVEKWDKPWFRKAAPRVKCLWLYLCDNCDHAGVIDPDWELISFRIGETVSSSDVAALNGNVVERNGKLFIPGFIRFQFGNLSQACKQHAPVFEALDRHKITENEWNKDGHLMPIQCPPSRAKEKEKDQEKDQEGKGSAEGKTKKFVKPTQAEMELHAAKIGLPVTEINKFVDYYESNGWKVGKNPMKSWPAAMQNWKRHYDDNKRQAAWFDGSKGARINSQPDHSKGF